MRPSNLALLYAEPISASLPTTKKEYGTRNWTVTASLYATLNDMFGNRTICGIGRGDSAMRVLGHKPSTLATLSESMKVILQLADLSLAEWTISAVRTAAEEAGRHPDDLCICVAAPAYVGTDLDHQREQCRWFGGMVGNHVADLVSRYGGDGSGVPAALTDYIKERESYDYSGHGKSGQDHTDFVPDSIVDSFCILGPEEKHVERLKALKELGVNQFAIYLMHDQKDETLNAYGQRIIPAVNR